jgi:hypothetical protein
MVHENRDTAHDRRRERLESRPAREWGNYSERLGENHFQLLLEALDGTRYHRPRSVRCRAVRENPSFYLDSGVHSLTAKATMSQSITRPSMTLAEG